MSCRETFFVTFKFIAFHDCLFFPVWEVAYGKVNSHHVVNGVRAKSSHNFVKVEWWAIGKER